ncbi:MAG: hypothetical protein K2X27_17610 [Candidatus Obscuribacterales bacterium]|nr:hypothetical protein [Candidatus Obscuribacterales bacterium]
MFHHRLLEIEAELAAKEQSKHKLEVLPPECQAMLSYLEKSVELRLGDKVPKDWVGWMSFRRNNKQSLVIIRGRAFKDGAFGQHRAGLDVPMGHDAITEYQRGFDVTPPQDLDHLLVNFGLDGDEFRIFLWYGENIAPYKLIFAANLADEPYKELDEAIVEACIWIIKRPKHQTLEAFLRESKK